MSSYLEMILDRGGGMITCGDHLGVMVGPPSSEAGCPRGWVFVPWEPGGDRKLALELLTAAVSHAKLGRAAWPAKEVFVD